MSRGRLITVEGIDGAGKTTLASGLVPALGARGIAARLLREPGGVLAAERVRELVKDPEMSIGARTEALLYAAARAQLVEEAVEPLLDDGCWVLLDRFVDSSLAYQGGGRELGLEQVQAVNDFATRGLRPDRTLLLVISPTAGRARTRKRGQPADRLERERDDFYSRIGNAYAELAAGQPDRIRVLDATQPAEQVLADAIEALVDLL